MSFYLFRCVLFPSTDTPHINQHLTFEMTPRPVPPTYLTMTPHVTLTCILPDHVHHKVMPIVDDVIIFQKDASGESLLASQSSSDVKASLGSPSDQWQTSVVGQVSSSSSSFLVVDLLNIKLTQPVQFQCKASGRDSRGNNVVLTSPVLSLEMYHF